MKYLLSLSVVFDFAIKYATFLNVLAQKVQEIIPYKRSGRKESSLYIGVKVKFLCHQHFENPVLTGKQQEPPTLNLGHEEIDDEPMICDDSPAEQSYIYMWHVCCEEYTDRDELFDHCKCTKNLNHK